jgi:hypothetical protein
VIGEPGAREHATLVAMRRGVTARFLALMVALSSIGCAHKQPTNRQLAIGAATVVGIGLLVYLAVEQCHKGANFCDNSPAP